MMEISATAISRQVKKGKVTPLQARLWPRGGRVIALLFQDLGAGSGQQHATAALYPRERPGTHCTGGWVGSRAGLDGRKISPPPGFDARTVQHKPTSKERNYQQTSETPSRITSLTVEEGQKL